MKCSRDFFFFINGSIDNNKYVYMLNINIKNIKNYKKYISFKNKPATV